MKKKLIALVLATVTTLGTLQLSNLTVKADTPKDFDWYGKAFWRNYFDRGWQYQLPNGKTAKGWIQDNGKWYLLGEDCFMKKGWQNINGHWYYLNPNGDMATGWKELNGVWFFLNEDGSMATGWKMISGHWYFLNSNGVMKTGWIQCGQNWYFTNNSGQMVTGEFNIGGKINFFNNDGVWSALTTRNIQRITPKDNLTKIDNSAEGYKRVGDFLTSIYQIYSHCSSVETNAQLSPKLRQLCEESKQIRAKGIPSDTVTLFNILVAHIKNVADWSDYVDISQSYESVESLKTASQNLVEVLDLLLKLCVSHGVYPIPMK